MTPLINPSFVTSPAPQSSEHQYAEQMFLTPFFVLCKEDFLIFWARAPATSRTHWMWRGPQRHTSKAERVVESVQGHLRLRPSECLELGKSTWGVRNNAALLLW